MQYFVKRKEKVNGPFTTAQIKSAAKSAKLNDTDLISNTEGGPWNTLGEALEKLQASAALSTSPNDPFGEALEKLEEESGEEMQASAALSTSPNDPFPKVSMKNLAIVSISTGGASVLSSCLGIVCCLGFLSFPLGLTAIGTGTISLLKMKNLSVAETAGQSKELAIGGIVLGALSVFLYGALLFIYLAIFIATENGL
jgi:hypothetical protein